MIRKHDIYIRPCLGEQKDSSGNPYKAYGEPVLIDNVTLNSISGSFEFIAYGERTKRMVQSLVDYDTYINKFNEDDLAYLYDASCKDEKYIGANANYKVVAVLPQNMKIRVLFEKLP